ncbi:hypothetical protein HanPI659440_Chr15g0592501 [Helianthus annuus]|nr:hypothetical protein HanPI659440_Chr15g0592501 [Helianthus annuus]
MASKRRGGWRWRSCRWEIGNYGNASAVVRPRVLSKTVGVELWFFGLFMVDFGFSVYCGGGI